MKGFTEKGLMLLPKAETYYSRDFDYQSLLKKSVSRAIEFFGSKGITFECFTTDEVANILDPKGVVWVNSSAPEDIFFIRKNVEGFSNIKEGKDLDDLYDKTRTKFPTTRGMELEERFEIVLGRDKYTANAYVAKQKFVLSFEHPQNPYYKVKEKEGDQRIIMRVHHNNFTVNCTMSGTPIDLMYIAEYKGSTRPIHMWEVE